MALKNKKKRMSPMEKARARLKRMQEGDKGNGDFLNPVTGKNVVRALPGPKEDDDWYVEAAYHYNLGPNKITTLCPAFVGRKCPACAKGAKLRKEAYRIKDEYEKGGEKSLKLKKAMDRAFQLAAQYKARNRFYLNVIPLVLGKETQSGKEVKILGAGAQIMNGIFTYYTDTDEYGNVLDLKKGRDFIITKKVTGKKAWDVDYEVKLRDRDRCKPVHSNRLKDLHDLAKLVGEYPSYEEVLAIMEGRASEESSDDDDDDDRAQSKLTRGKKTKKRRREEEDEDDEDESEDEDEDSDEDEDEEEEERPRKKKGKKKASRRDDDDEEEEDDEDESDDDSDSDDDEDDEDSDEGEEDDEDEDEDDSEDDDSDDEDDDDVDGDDDRPRRSKVKDKLKRKARR